MENRASEAIVLHHLDYGEADRIVTLFSLEQGLVKGFARRARNSRKRFGAALEPYASVHVRWQSRSQGDMVTLQDADLIDLRRGLRQDLSALALAAYGCELVESLLGETESQPEVYRLLAAFLDHVHRHGGTADTRLLFELRLLCLAGYEPHLLHCSSCGASLRSDTVAFCASMGGALCLDCDTGPAVQYLSPLTLGSLSRLLRTPPTLFEGVRLGSRTLHEGGRALASLLGQYLCRPLKSLAFLEQISPAIHIEGTAPIP